MKVKKIVDVLQEVSSGIDLDDVSFGEYSTKKIVNALDEAVELVKKNKKLQKKVEKLKRKIEELEQENDYERD